MALPDSKMVVWIVFMSAFACDDRRECGPNSICISPPQFQQAQIISAWPARMTTSGATPVCDGSDADGVIVNAVLLSSQRPSLGSPTDVDVSIRPGDNIDGHIIDGPRTDDIHVSEESVSIALNCLNPANSLAIGCEDGLANSNEDARVRYVANTASRGVGHEVVVLIDLSGDAMVSDVLLAGATSLVRRANTQDNVSVFGFDEMMRPCTVDVAGAAPITCAMSSGARRSSLWQAVASSYDLLRRGSSEAGRSMHIVVLASGPDSCASEAHAGCTTPCATADPRDIASRIATDREDLTLAPIHIDFVQLDTVQQPGRDARQVALACASGGHYQFINASTIPMSGNALNEAIDTAVGIARHTWMGHWELVLPLSAYSARAPGAMYALEGTLEIDAGSNLVGSDQQFPFGIGMGAGAPSARNWDRRPTLLKPCTMASDCGPNAASSCVEACSHATGLCATEGASVWRPDLSYCEVDDGMPGFCCGGDCRTSGQCEACDTR